MRLQISETATKGEMAVEITLGQTKILYKNLIQFFCHKKNQMSVCVSFGTEESSFLYNEASHRSCEGL